jgi:hypothetical protein
MADPVEIVGLGIGGATVGGLLMKALGWSSQRNVAHIDAAFLELREVISDLRKEVQLLRENSVATAEKLGAQRMDNERLRERVEKLAEYWQQQFKLRRGAK